VPEANLRQGPGTNHEKGWQVFKYMPLQKIGQKGDWYQMKDVDGDEHWIYSKLVTNDIRCAVVKVKSANVRTGPGTNHKSLFAEPV
jgi:SH3-like domain-containing protein